MKSGVGQAAHGNGPARRAGIVHQSIGVFARYGYDGASLRILAAEAGMEKGHFSYYFPTKEDLLFEVVHDLHQRFLDGIQRWTADYAGNDYELLAHVFRCHTEMVFHLHQQTRVAYESLRFLSEERRATVNSKRRRYEHELAQCIEQCRAAGFPIAPAPTQFLAKAVLGLLNWPYQWYSPSGSHTPTELSEILTERALAAVRILPPVDNRE